jgi:hypothetical protein
VFILKNKIVNKILHKNKQYRLCKKQYELSLEENEKLKNEIKHLKENEILLKNQNNKLIEDNNSIPNLINENKSIKNQNKRLEKLNTFITFQEFLPNSYVSPLINAPFHAVDKRIFAFMDHISKYLSNNTKNNENEPLVSIIMLTSNEKNIQNTINSVLKQTYENWELILLNHASTDNSREIAHSYKDSRIKHIDYPINIVITFVFNADSFVNLLQHLIFIVVSRFYSF